MKDFDCNELYVVDGSFLNAIKRTMERLYAHDFKRLNADESRDLANMLNARLASNPILYEE